MSGNAYVSELRAERDRLREVVARVEGLADQWERRGAVRDFGLSLTEAAKRLRVEIRDALCASSPSAEQRYTETDGPAPAGPYAATEGAGDGV